MTLIRQIFHLITHLCVVEPDPPRLRRVADDEDDD